MDWDEYFLDLAQFVSRKSKDPSTKVGAVITDKNHVLISCGFNGLARNVRDTEERLTNRELKYKLIIHAEVNSILFARRSLENCILYCWPFMPCSNCASVVIQSGIKKVIAPFKDNYRWAESFKLSREIFLEAGVELVEVK